MAFSAYFKNVVLAFIFGRTQYLAPPVYDLGFSLTDPLVDGSGLTEPSVDSGYERIPVSPADRLHASAGVTTNFSVLTFPVATENWGTLTHFMLFAAAGMILYGELDPHQAVVAGQRSRFNSTKLKVFVD